MSRRMIIAVASVAIWLGGSAFSTTRAATTGPGEFQQRMQQAKQALSQLDLTSSQRAKIKQICERAKSKLEAMKNSASNSATTYKTQERQIIKAAGEKIMAVLTPAQQAKLKQMMKSATA